MLTLFFSLSLCLCLGLTVTADPGDILGKYLGKNELLVQFVRKFDVDPQILNYLSIQEMAALNPNSLSNIMSWELVALGIGAQNKQPLNICRYSELMTLSENYDTTGNLQSLVCILEVMKVNIEEEVHNINKLFLEKAGCGEFYQKPVVKLPTCIDPNCKDAGRLNNWKILYEIIIKQVNDYQIPVNPKIYDELEKLVNSNQQNLHAVVGIWFGTLMHTVLLAKKDLAYEPPVAGVPIKVLEYMEYIANDQDTSCLEKNILIKETSYGVINAIIPELEFVKKSYLET